MLSNRNQSLSLEELSYRIFYSFLQQENFIPFFQDKNVIKIISDYWNPFDIFYCPISKKEMTKPTYVSHPEIKPFVYDYSSLISAIKRDELAKFGITFANKNQYLKNISHLIIPIIKILKEHDQHLISLDDKKINNPMLRNNCNFFNELNHAHIQKSETINPSQIINLDYFFIRKKNNYLEFKPPHEMMTNELQTHGSEDALSCERFFIAVLSTLSTALEQIHSPNLLSSKPSILFYWHQQLVLLEAISKRHFRIFQNIDTVLHRSGISPHQFYSNTQQFSRLLTTGFTLIHQSYTLFALYSEFNKDPFLQTIMTFVVTPLKAIELVTYFDIAFENKHKFIPQMRSIPHLLLSGISITALLTQTAIENVPFFWRYTLPLIHFPRIMLASHQTIHEAKELIQSPKKLLDKTCDEQGFTENSCTTFFRRLSRFGLFLITLYSCMGIDNPIWMLVTALAFLNESSLSSAVKNADNRYRLMPPPQDMKQMKKEKSSLSAQFKR